MKEETQYDIPFQVMTLIDSMNNKKDSDYIRTNFRMRLTSIRNAIDAAIAAYDNEVSFVDRPKTGTKRRK